MPRRLARLLPNPGTVRGKLGIAAFLVAFFVLAGSTAGYAYWVTSVSATSTVGAATLSLSTSNFTSVGYTFGNDALVTTGSVTVANTTTTSSTRSGAVTLTFGPAATATLAGKVTASVWSTTSAANCTATTTVPGGATTALWSASPAVSTTLAPGASAVYCIRSSVASRETLATSGGSMTFSPKITATITVGSFTGSTSATTTQSSQYVYPAATPDTTHWMWIRPNFSNASYDYCADVSGAGSTTGTIVISYDCKTSGAANQQWDLSPSGVTGYFTIAPRNASGLRIDDNSSTASGAAVTVNTAGTASTATNQQWQLQTVSPGVYEIVSAYSGMCLTSMSGTGENLGGMTQAPCAGTVYQQFLLSQAFQSFSCSTGLGSWTWSWTSAATGPYHVLVTHGGTMSEVATTATTASGATLAFSTVSSYGLGTFSVSFVDGNGTLVGTGTITANFLNLGNGCTANDLQ